MNITVIEPYDDDKLVWNTETDHYELSFEYIRSNYEVNFRDDKELKRRLTKNSRKIYNFIYARTHTANKAVATLLLNKTEQGRKFLFDVLIEEFEADNATGYNDLSQNPAINLSNGSVIDRNLLIQNQICVDAEQIIDRNREYFGINIMFQGQLPLIFYQLANRG